MNLIIVICDGIESARLMFKSFVNLLSDVDYGYFNSVDDAANSCVTSSGERFLFIPSMVLKYLDVYAKHYILQSDFEDYMSDFI